MKMRISRKMLTKTLTVEDLGPTRELDTQIQAIEYDEREKLYHCYVAYNAQSRKKIIKERHLQKLSTVLRDETDNWVGAKIRWEVKTFNSVENGTVEYVDIKEASL